MLLCKTKGSREDTIEIVVDERGSIKGGDEKVLIYVYIFLSLSVTIWMRITWRTLYSGTVKEGGEGQGWDNREAFPVGYALLYEDQVGDGGDPGSFP